LRTDSYNVQSSLRGFTTEESPRVTLNTTLIEITCVLDALGVFGIGLEHVEQEVDVSGGELERLNLAELVARQGRYNLPERGERLVQALRPLAFPDVRHRSLSLKLLIVLAAHLRPRCRGRHRGLAVGFVAVAAAIAAAVAVVVAAVPPLSSDSRPNAALSVSVTLRRRRRRRLGHVAEFDGLFTAVSRDVIDHPILDHIRFILCDVDVMVRPRLTLNRLDGAGGHLVDATGRVHALRGRR